MRVLITRPEPDATSTASRVATLGHEPIIAPLMRIVPTGAAIPPGPYAALIVTSRHAVDALSGDTALKSIPTYCVGEATAARARAAGFHHAIPGGGDAKALAETIRRSVPEGAALLYAAGVPRKPDLERGLESEFRLSVVETYRTEPVAALPDEARAALVSGSLTILHLSRGSAELFLRLAEMSGLGGEARQANHIVLSSDIAEIFEAFGAPVMTAREPTLDAVLTLLGHMSA